MAQPVLEGLRQRLAQRRPSLPSWNWQQMFEEFERRTNSDINEGTAMSDLVSIMAGNSNIPTGRNVLFSQLHPMTNNTTVQAKPDFYDGAWLWDVDAAIVCGELAPFIVPAKSGPIAPNFFLEVKGPTGNMEEAVRQACYDGAIGARGMRQLQLYKQEVQIYDGNAYTITSVYLARPSILQIYAVYPIAGENGTTKYYMTLLGGW